MPTLASAPWEVFLVSVVLAVAPAVATRQSSVWQLLALVVSTAIALFAPTIDVAYGAVAVGALLLAAAAMPRSRTGAFTLLVTAVTAVGTAVAADRGALTLAFALSTLTVALRAGVVPFHGGVASMCERVPLVQTQQLSTLIALVFVHLRFVDHHDGAILAAPMLVRYGACAAIAAALMTLVQTDLRGYYRGTTAMHAGMLLAALGAASLDNFAAALLVAVSMAVALGGIGMMVTALEERVGAVAFAGPGGRAAAFPRLAVLFALFGGASVGLPGTSGFVADDLLMHTMWKESPAGTALVIVSAALVSVATLITYSKVFLGRQTFTAAPDLGLRERIVGATLFVLLVVLGAAPALLLTPADSFLSAPPPGLP